LAGGLDDLNVADATKLPNVIGVDASSGLELKTGRKGVKDSNKIKKFIRNAKL
jgi:phosphoribosylanthranilate isomerase